MGLVTSGQGPEPVPHATADTTAPAAHLDLLCRPWKVPWAWVPHGGWGAGVGGVRNVYVPFSNFVLFRFDLSDFLKLIFCTPDGIMLPHFYGLS